MPVTKVSYHVLAVGQGNGTFVVYQDEQDNVLDVVVMDFGSDMTTERKSGTAALLYALKFLDRQQFQPKQISAVFFSHSDYDHISLMSRLLDYFPRGRADLAVNGICYGGAYEMYTKTSPRTRAPVNVIERLMPYTSTGVIPGPKNPNSTSFSGARAAPEFVVQQSFPYYLLVANTAGPRRAAAIGAGNLTSDSHLINTESLVVVSEISGRAFVMAGDATAQTLEAVNKLLCDSSAASKAVADVFHATIPHHGSQTTTTAKRGLGKGGDWERTLRDYTNSLSAKSVSVTAGIANSHYHPAAVIVQYYWPYVAKKATYQDPELKPAGLHLTTEYFDSEDPVGPGGDNVWPPQDQGSSWQTVQTASAVFTNHYWATGGTKILPPLPVKDAETDPAKLDRADRPTEVHWEFAFNIKTKKVSIYRYDSGWVSDDLVAAVLAGGAIDPADLPDWPTIRRLAGATDPVMTLDLSGSPRSPRRRPRRSR